jgi:DNA (cytosine-5)-methyltransferase 1
VPDPGSESVGSSGARSPTTSVNWGSYEVAIRRWEALLGRPAPHPTQLGNHGRPVLAPAFVEWLMGLPPGWVTDLPLPRTAQLRALGNGVVPQQAAHAVSLLLEDLAALLHTDRQPVTGREVAAA